MLDCRMNRWRFGINYLARLFHSGTDFRYLGVYLSVGMEKRGRASLMFCESSARTKVASVAPEGTLEITLHPNK